MSKKSALYSCAGLIALSLSAAAAWAAPLNFDIPAQDAVKAIPEFGRQAGVQVVAPADRLKGVRTIALRGVMEAKHALNILLRGTGLEIASDDGRVIVLRVAETTAQSQAPSPPTNAAAPPATPAANEDHEVEKVTVTGTRIRGANSPSPVVVITRKQIERTGASGVGDAVLSIPQNAGSANANRFTNNSPDAAATANLRGLGEGATLVLINGHRPAPSAASSFSISSFQSNAFNLNTLPLAAVERIEILSDGASAIYGSDALGGVINVILRSNYDGAEASTRYGNTTNKDASEVTQSLLFGVSEPGTSLLLAGEYSHREGIRGWDRDFSVAAAQRSLSPAERRSFPANIFAVAGNLPGLTSSFAAVPPGQDGRSLTIGSFTTTQGTLNTPYFAAVFTPLYKPQERATGFLNFEHDINDFVSLFLQANAAYTQTVAETLGGFSNVLVPAANPYNPFGADVRASFYLPQAPQSLEVQTWDEGVAAGVRGSFNTTGAWDLTLTQGNSRFAHDQFIPNLPFLNAALASTNPQTAFNVFDGTGQGNSRAVIDSIMLRLNRSNIRTNTKSAGVKTDFAAWSLPAGDIKTALGGEWRTESFNYYRSTSAGVETKLRDSRDVTAAFAEVLAPLIGPGSENAQPQLELSLAGRIEDYSDFGETSNPKIGVLWRPLDALTLRASYGTSFIAPSFSQKGSPPTFVNVPLTVFDPFFGTNVVFNSLTFRGNDKLGPETGKAFTAGGTFSPDWIDNFVLSVNVYSIDYTDKISVVAFTLAPQLEADFPGLVVRDPVTHAITNINSMPVNVASVTTRGGDASLAFKWPTAWGDFDLGVYASYVDSYKTQSSRLAPVVQRVDRVGFPVDWQLSGTLFYSNGPVETGIVVHYVDSYASIAPPQLIASATLVDYQFSYDLKDFVDHPVKVTVGVLNVFDRDPPTYLGSSQGIDYINADPRGRQVYLQLNYGLW